MGAAASSLCEGKPQWRLLPVACAVLGVGAASAIGCWRRGGSAASDDCTATSSTADAAADLIEETHFGSAAADEPDGAEGGKSFEEQVEEERQILEEAVRTLRLVRRTGAYRALPHPFLVDKQLSLLESRLREVAGYLRGSMTFWRYGRDEPMAALLELPLLQLAAARGALVPLTSGHVKEVSNASRLGEVAVARFLCSGTDASVSRYHEYSHGILDALRRDELLQCLERMFWSVWDLPLTWGDEDDCLPLGGSVNPHNASAFGVAMRTQWEAFGEQTGLSS